MATIVALAGVSGAGKTHITKIIEREDGFVHVPTITTRSPRAGETDGVDRTFVTEARFEDMRRSGDLICAAHQFGAWYGTAAEDIRRNLAYGRKTICQIRYTSVNEFRSAFPNALLVYIVPSDPAKAISSASRRGEASRATDTTDELHRMFDGRLLLNWDVVMINRYLPECERRLRQIIASVSMTR